MAINSLSRAYGAQYAGLVAVISESTTNMPATVYSSSNGAYPSRDGSVKLGAQGQFTVWLDDQKQYICRIYNPLVGVGVNGLVKTDWGLEVGQEVPAYPTNSQVTQAGGPVAVAVTALTGGALYDGLGNIAAGGVGSTVNSITYSLGRVSSYMDNGITYTLGYDGSGRVSTISDGTRTRTVTYNVDGSVASYA